MERLKAWFKSKAELIGRIEALEKREKLMAQAIADGEVGAVPLTRVIDWHEANELALKQFIQSDTGRKFRCFLEQQSQALFRHGARTCEPSNGLLLSEGRAFDRLLNYLNLLGKCARRLEESEIARYTEDVDDLQAKLEARRNLYNNEEKQGPLGPFWNR